MPPAATTIFIKPSQFLYNHRRFNTFLHNILLSNPSSSTLKQSATKSVRFKKTMATNSTDTTLVNSDHDDKPIIIIIPGSISGLKQETLVIANIHTLLNGLSKWIVAVGFSGLIMLRRDPLALWAATGTISNFVMSLALKRILKQERPVSDVGSGPGMPSSHAQSMFFILVFVIMSVIEWVGMNGTSAILGVLLVVLASYFTWLRVLLGYHTTSQIIVGKIVGSAFAVFWFWAWKAIVHKAYNSNLWVQVFVALGVSCHCLGFIRMLVDIL